MPEKRHFALGLTDGHLKLPNKRRTFLLDDDLMAFGVFDMLQDNPANAEAAERMVEVFSAALTENRRIIDRYTQSGGYYHRVRASLTVELAMGQATREARAVLGQGVLPRLSVLLLMGRNVIVARHLPAEFFHIRDQKVRHFTKPLPGEAIRDDSGVTNASSKSAIARARRESPIAGSPGSRNAGSAGPVGSAVSGRTPKLEFFHRESQPGDVFVVCNQALGEHLADAWTGDIDLEKSGERESSSDNLRLIVRQLSLSKPNQIITGVFVKVTGAATDELRLEEKVAPLRSIPVFKALQTNELLKVLQLMEVREFKAWERIISEDEPGELLYVGVKGKYNVYKKHSLIAELSEGAVFGEIGFLNNLPRTADVVATEKTTMLVLSRSKIRKLLATEPQVASHLLWSLCQVLTDRLAKTTQEFSKLMEELKAQGQGKESIGLTDDQDDRSYSPHRSGRRK